MDTLSDIGIALGLLILGLFKLVFECLLLVFGPIYYLIRNIITTIINLFSNSKSIEKLESDITSGYSYCLHKARNPKVAEKKLRKISKLELMKAKKERQKYYRVPKNAEWVL